MATMNISLPEQMRNWIQSQIDDGKYASSSDYVRNLIRKDLEQHEKIALLQEALNKGLASGVSEDFDMESLIRRLKLD